MEHLNQIYAAAIRVFGESADDVFAALAHSIGLYGVFASRRKRKQAAATTIIDVQAR